MFPRLFLLYCFAFAALPPPSAFSKEDAYVEGEVLVTFKAAVPEAAAEKILQRRALGFARRHDKGSKRKPQRISGLVREKTRSTADLIKEIRNDSAVEAVEPNYLRHVSADSPGGAGFPKLWGLSNTGQTVNATAGVSGVDVKFLPAWKLARPAQGAGEVVIAVADTGVDIAHPDLAPGVWVNPGEIAGNGIDDDGNGYTDDVHGYDFAEDTAVITDSGVHGTHVAGSMAATGAADGGGVTGVQPHARILPLKISRDGDSMTTSAALAAFHYVIDLKERGVNIVAINASYGGSSFTVAERTAIEALRDAGILLCAAAGNDGADNDQMASYPANYNTSNILSVAALNQSGGLADFSNYGATTVDLAAPGVNVFSTVPLNTATVFRVTVAGMFYAATPIEHSGLTGETGAAGTVYSCGLGKAEDFPAAVRGNIALIQRGEITFAEKVSNAMNAGAAAALVYDNTADAVDSGGWTLGAAGPWIPALHLTRGSGQALLAKLPAAGTVVNATNPAAAYRFLQGTSMAAPHVTGAVAFAALNFPLETMSERRTRILKHVTPLPSLSGKTVTGGLLNLAGMVDADGRGLPDWWEGEFLTAAGLSRGVRDDPDGDSFTNRQEFLSGTNPAVPGSRPGFLTLSTGGGSAQANLILTFQGVEGFTWQPEWCQSPEAGPWRALGAPVTGTGEPLQVTDFGALSDSPRRFYRLRLLSVSE